MLGKPKRKIDGHLIPHSSYLLIFGKLHRNRVAHSRTARWDAVMEAEGHYPLTFNVSGHFRATGALL